MDIFTFVDEVFIRHTIHDVVLSRFVQIREVFWHDLVKDRLADTRHHNLLFLLISKRFVRKGVRRNPDTAVQMNIAILQRHQYFIGILEDHAFAFAALLLHGQVVVT